MMCNAAKLITEWQRCVNRVVSSTREPLPQAMGDEMVSAVDAVGVDGALLVSSIDARPQ
jgi:hypothetical protein